MTSGALDAIERALREYLRPGDAVGVEDPSFPGLLDLVAAAGYVRTPIAVDDEGVVPAALRDALPRVKAVMLTPRAQNPTGATHLYERVGMHVEMENVVFEKALQ